MGHLARSDLERPELTHRNSGICSKNPQGNSRTTGAITSRETTRKFHELWVLIESMGAAESSDAEGSSKKNSAEFFSTNCCTACRNPWQEKDRRRQSASDNCAEYQLRHLQSSTIRRGVVQSKIHVGMVGGESTSKAQLGTGTMSTTSTKLSADEIDSQRLARTRELQKMHEEALKLNHNTPVRIAVRPGRRSSPSPVSRLHQSSDCSSRRDRSESPVRCNNRSPSRSNRH